MLTVQEGCSQEKAQGEGLGATQEEPRGFQIPLGPLPEHPSLFSEALMNTSYVSGEQGQSLGSPCECARHPGRVVACCCLSLLSRPAFSLGPRQQAFTECHTGPGTAEQGRCGGSEAWFEAVIPSEGPVERDCVQDLGEARGLGTGHSLYTVSSNLIDIEPQITKN